MGVEIQLLSSVDVNFSVISCERGFVWMISLKWDEDQLKLGEDRLEVG
jgi:hypothetical protein